MYLCENISDEGSIGFAFPDRDLAGACIGCILRAKSVIFKLMHLSQDGGGSWEGWARLLLGPGLSRVLPF